MPISYLGQNLLGNHHGIAVKKFMPKLCPNLKTQWNRECIKRIFPHLGKSNVRKNPPTVALYRSCLRVDPLIFFTLLLSIFVFADLGKLLASVGFPNLKPFCACLIKLCSSRPTYSSPQRKLNARC